MGPCHTDGTCCGPGSYCCANTGPHEHPEVEQDAAAPTPPRRAYHLTIEVDADSYSDLVDALSDLEFEVFHKIRKQVSGGASRGWWFRLDVDPEMTHERFVELNSAYVKAIHAEPTP